MIEIDSNEEIVRVVRKHWIILFGDILALALLFFAPVIIFTGLHFLPFPVNLPIEWQGSSGYALSFFFLTWVFVVWMKGWDMWTDYYLDVLIITNKRVFTIDQQGLFKRTSSSFRYDRIQDITIRMDGVIATLLDYGTITIETAGEGEDFTATAIPDPYEIKKQINAMQDTSMDKSQEVHLTPEVLDRIAPN